MLDQIEMIEHRGVKYAQFHGSPFDRGAADSYYGRPQEPHWYPNGTGNAPRITSQDMSLKELRAYFAGYEYNELSGNKKEWA